jgi:pSer/pThr/pTyr-binding forkhead associated (FHA) protein
VLRGVTGAVFGRSYHLLAPTTVGRAPECDICLTNSGISRLHARLRPLDYGVEVEDLKSTNGSFLNGQRIGVGIARIGDEIAFDQLRFRVSEVHKPRQAAGGVRKGVQSPWRWLWVAIAVALAVGALVAFATRWLG